MKKTIVLTAISALFLTIFSACSSAPKRAMEINTISSACATTLENANAAILSGDFDKAKHLLSQATTQATSIDNYDLLISTKMAYVSLCLSMNPPEYQNAMDYYLAAQEYVPFSENQNRNEALCTLAKIRIAIFTSPEYLNFDSLIKELSKSQKVFSKEPFNHAQCYSILGDLYRIKGDRENAEKAYINAAKEFTDQRYLSEIGITWYKVAQNRSLSGNKKGALEALDKAIFYDRCAENSMALGSDYYIKGIILLKGNASDMEKARAEAALKHSAEIFDSIGNVEMANRSLALIDSEKL